MTATPDWVPDLARRRGPRYRAIAEALADDVASGRLVLGTRLPTHRDLAWKLGVTVGTVSRAYAEAERRGLIGGEVGRGTFVRGRAEAPPAAAAAPAPDIDLAVNVVSSGGEVAALEDTLGALARDGRLGDLLGYLPHAGLPAHRAAIARLLAALEVPVPADRIVLTASAQHAMLVTLTALTRPGDTVGCEQLTYAGFKAVLRLLHLRPKGIAMDAEGIRPDALDQACRETGLRALYVCPTLQNPTGVTLSLERRQAIVAVARRHDLQLIEDDVYGFLAPGGPPPFALLAPERTCYINGTSKCLAPGLRVAFVVGPAALAGALAAGVRATVWMAPPLMVEVVRRWIDDGRLMGFVEAKRRIGRERQALARRLLGAAGGQPAPTHPQGLHLWLPLPEPWTDEAFAAALGRQGVAVTPGSAFAIGRPPLEAVRLALGSPATPDDLARGLDRVADLLRDTPEPHPSIV